MQPAEGLLSTHTRVKTQLLKRVLVLLKQIKRQFTEYKKGLNTEIKKKTQNKTDKHRRGLMIDAAKSLEPNSITWDAFWPI